MLIKLYLSKEEFCELRYGAYRLSNLTIFYRFPDNLNNEFL
jgi:hypothetical protein